MQFLIHANKNSRHLEERVHPLKPREFQVQKIFLKRARVFIATANLGDDCAAFFGGNLMGRYHRKRCTKERDTLSRKHGVFVIECTFYLPRSIVSISLFNFLLASFDEKLILRLARNSNVGN